MEILGTHFTLTLGAWRLRFVLAVEENPAEIKEKTKPPHRLHVPREDQYV